MILHMVRYLASVPFALHYTKGLQKEMSSILADQKPKCGGGDSCGVSANT